MPALFSLLSSIPLILRKCFSIALHAYEELPLNSSHFYARKTSRKSMKYAFIATEYRCVRLCQPCINCMYIRVQFTRVAASGHAFTWEIWFTRKCGHFASSLSLSFSLSLSLSLSVCIFHLSTTNYGKGTLLWMLSTLYHIKLWSGQNVKVSCFSDPVFHGEFMGLICLNSKIKWGLLQKIWQTRKMKFCVKRSELHKKSNMYSKHISWVEN